MPKIKIRESYVDRCRNYMLWLGNSLFEPDSSLPLSSNHEGVSAIEAMLVWESRSECVPCNEPYLLDCLKKGKQSREFLIKGWLSMTRAGEAQPEEFYGICGLRSSKEFRGIFGRLPSLHHLVAIRTALVLQIHAYEDILNPPAANSHGLTLRSLKRDR